jgi:hypothetical protein
MKPARGIPVLALASWLLALAGPTAGLAQGGSAPPVAVVVHLLGGPSALLPADARELRLATLDGVSALLNAQGLLASDRALTETLVRRHLVRTGSAFAPAFLAEVAAEAGAQVLLAVGVRTDGARLTIGIRAVSTADGGLLGIGLAETVAGPAGWRHDLTAATRAALPALAPTAPAPTLLVLPARTMGAGPQAARAATSCLLAAALADGAWRPVDPALLAGAVADAGCDLERLDARGRAVLRDRFGATWAAVPEIVSFGTTARRGGLEPLLEPGPADQAGLSEFALSVRLLDLSTGLVRGTASIRLDGGPVRGWFGEVEHPSDLERIRAAAEQAWSRFQLIIQEKAS